MANVDEIRAAVAACDRDIERSISASTTVQTLILGAYRLIVGPTGIALTRTPGEIVGMTCFKLSDTEAKVLRDTLNELWPKENDA